MLLFYIKKEDTSGSDLTAESVPLGNTEEVSFNNIISQDNDIVNDSVCTDVKDVYNGDVNTVLEEFVVDVMSGMFDIQRGIGFGFPFSKMPVSRIEEILKNNWSGQHFSARIWGRAEDINQTLKEELLTQFMTGRSYRKTASEISDRMAVGAYEARRLVRTESTYIANSAELESYKECGIEQFRFLATLDMRTSDLCASMDGKVFSVEEGVPGTNIPPLHPWCRSTTVAVIDGAVLSDLKRRARDPETGKPYLVSADTTYEEWKKELDQRFGEGYSTTKRKMVQNRAKDSKQYQNYLSVLGKENMPKSLDEFQNLKYNNKEEWKALKKYKSLIKSGELTPLADFKLYQEISNEIDHKLVGKLTSNGIKITGKSNHFIARVIGSVEQRRNGVNVHRCFLTVTQPKEIEDVRRNQNGNSQKFIGKNAAVTINPDSGLLIQVNPLHEK